MESIRKVLHASGDRLEELGAVIGPQILPTGTEFHMESILEAMIRDFDSRWGDGSDIQAYSLGTHNTNKGQPCGYTKTQVICLTLDPRMVMLPQVQEEQEESVWLVLQDRCQEMILEDQVQRDKGPADGVPGAVPHNTENSQSSAHSNLLGCKKVSKIVMTPVSVTGHVAVDTSKLANEVSPIKTYTLYLS